MTFELPKLECKCLQVLQNNQVFEVTVDLTKLSEKDNGEYEVKVTLLDGSSPITIPYKFTVRIELPSNNTVLNVKNVTETSEKLENFNSTRNGSVVSIN